MRTTRVSADSVLVAAAAFMALGASQGLSQALEPPRGIRFEVVSVNELTGDESHRRSPPDVIGWDHSVRLRLTTSDTPVLVLVPSEPTVLAPLGYSVLIEGDRLKWRSFSAAGGIAEVSPGIECLLRDGPTQWIVLAPFSALEWEKVTAVDGAVQNQAYTIFIKQRVQGDPVEISSTAF